MTFRYLILIIYFSIFVLNCSGSADSGTNSPNKEITDKPTPAPTKAYDKCQSPLNLTSTFEKSCSLGSNINLCASSSTGQCDDKTTCLLDFTKSSPKSYCTVNCSPHDKSSCPSHFACQQEKCNDSYVCVRVEAGGPLDNLQVGHENIPPGTTDYGIFSTAVSKRGDLMILTSGSDVIFRSQKGQWTKLNLKYPELSEFYFKKVVDIDNSFYLFHANAYYNRDPRTVYKFDGEELTRIPTPSEIPGELCNEVSNLKCEGEVYQFWKGKEDGNLRAIVRNAEGYVVYKLDNKKWEKQSSHSDQLKWSADIKTKVLEDGSYFSQSRESKNSEPQPSLKVMLSKDLIQWSEFKLPKYINPINAYAYAFAANDIWIFDGNNKLFRWTGSKWLKEVHATGPSDIFKIGKNKYIITNYGGSTVSQKGCWRHGFPYFGELVIPVGNLAGFMKDDKLILFDHQMAKHYRYHRCRPS